MGAKREDDEKFHGSDSSAPPRISKSDVRDRGIGESGMHSENTLHRLLSALSTMGSFPGRPGNLLGCLPRPTLKEAIQRPSLATLGRVRLAVLFASLIANRL